MVWKRVPHYWDFVKDIQLWHIRIAASLWKESTWYQWIPLTKVKRGADVSLVLADC